MRLINMLNDETVELEGNMNQHEEFIVKKLDEKESSYAKALMTFAKCVDVVEKDEDIIKINTAKLLKYNKNNQAFMNLFVSEDIDEVELELIEAFRDANWLDDWYEKLAKSIKAPRPYSNKVSVAQLQSARKYDTKFDKITVRVEKGIHEEYKRKMRLIGYESFNQFVIDAIEEKLQAEM